MGTTENRNPDPKDPNEKNQQEEQDKKINPSKPGSDPDQTPEREIDNPPVAEPEEGNKKPGKIGFRSFW